MDAINPVKMRGVKSAAIAFSTILIFLAFMISIIVLCSPNLVNPHYTIALLTIKPVTGAGPSIYFGLLGENTVISLIRKV